jgi:hypothetical protein
VVKLDFTGRFEVKVKFSCSDPRVLGFPERFHNFNHKDVHKLIEHFRDDYLRRELSKEGRQNDSGAEPGSTRS